MNERLKIAEMLATRLCHDLTGPIGAVRNGTEFLGDEEISGSCNVPPEILELISTSAEESVCRIQFYRQAYGRINPRGVASLAEKKTMVEEFLAKLKIKLEWEDKYLYDMPESITSQATGRLLLNMIINAQYSLIKGGTITVKLNNENSLIHLTAAGESIKDNQEIKTIINSCARNYQPIDYENAPTITPENVQTYLMIEMAKELELKLEVVSDEHSYNIIAA